MKCFASRVSCFGFTALLVLSGAISGQFDLAGNATGAEVGAATSNTLIDAVSSDGFFSKLATDAAFEKDLRVRLADATYRSWGDTRSVRVQMWRETTTESPAIVLEYQTQWDRLMDLPNTGPAQFDPVQTGTGRDSMLFRTFYGATDDSEVLNEFKALIEKRQKTASNRRATLNPEFVALAKKHLPNKPLPEVRESVKQQIMALVDSHKADGAHLIENPVYGHFGAKITDRLYLYLRDFPVEAETRFEHDPFFWLIISGGPKPMPSGFTPAFPGAEGPGSLATGGRGGKVIYVTNLNPDGPGSYQQALLTKGPRIILFNVSGQIKLPDPTWIREPNATIIGYTAPGEGVEIHGRLNIAADNIILRGMRYRLRPPLKDDGMNTEGNLRNIMFDHDSFAYDSDEALRFIGNGSTFLGFSIQHCILGPGLAGLSAHPYGPEVGGYGAFHHNLFYNTLSRSPEVDCDLIDWSYNIMANLRSGHSLRPQSRFKFTHNYIIDMPVTLDNYSFNANEAVWAEGNLRKKGERVGADNISRSSKAAYLKTGYETMPLTHNAADSLMELLLPTAGACLPVRDKTDEFFIRMLKKNESKLPVLKSNMANWRPYGSQNDRLEQYIPWEDSDCPPVAAGVKSIVDTDSDGMPDEWETAHGLNVNNPSDGPLDSDQDGYTNIEEFLYRTNPHKFVDYTKPENNKETVFTGEVVAKAQQ